MKTPSDEIVSLVDATNTIIGTAPRSIMRHKGLAHRACYILVFNQNNRLFVHKRTQTKDVFPGFWAVAVGGVVLAGEDYLHAAHRELEEELGITKTKLAPLFDHYYIDAHNKIWGRVFQCRAEGPFILQQEEIECGMFFGSKALSRLIQTKPVTPDGLEILRRLKTHNAPEITRHL